MTDYDRLLAGIRENPACDTRRGVLADWLEEHGGQPAFGQFVRVQLQLAIQRDPKRRLPASKANDRLQDELQARERELWPAVRPVFEGYGCEPTLSIDAGQFRYEGSWRRQIQPGEYQVTTEFSGPHATVLVSRGLPAAVRCTLAEWRGGECEWCDGDGSHVDLSDGTPIDCDGCHGTGRTPGIGPRLAQRWPVERVEVKDAVIHPSGGNGTYYVGGLGVFPQKYWHQLEGHRSRHAALAALSDALLAEARAQPLEVTT